MKIRQVKLDCDFGSWFIAFRGRSRATTTLPNVRYERE